MKKKRNRTLSKFTVNAHFLSIFSFNFQCRDELFRSKPQSHHILILLYVLLTLRLGLFLTHV